MQLRHGIAEDGEPDAARPLSPEGRRRTAAVLERLLQLGLGVDQLASSPLLRARQTAELALAAGLAPGGLALAAGLAPDRIAPLHPAGEEGAVEAALCRRWRIEVVLCRRSGGPSETHWRRICSAMGLRLLLLERPPEPEGATLLPLAALLERVGDAWETRA